MKRKCSSLGLSLGFPGGNWKGILSEILLFGDDCLCSTVGGTWIETERLDWEVIFEKSTLIFDRTFDWLVGKITGLEIR